MIRALQVSCSYVLQNYKVCQLTCGPLNVFSDIYFILDISFQTQQQLAKNIGEYQDGVDLSCSVNDMSRIEAMDTYRQHDKGTVKLM